MTFLLAPLAWAAGFGNAGVGVSTWASMMQAAYYGGAASGLFSLLQSVGATATYSSVLAGGAAYTTLLGWFGAAVTARPAKAKYIRKYSGCDCTEDCDCPQYSTQAAANKALTLSRDKADEKAAAEKVCVISGRISATQHVPIVQRID